MSRSGINKPALIGRRGADLILSGKVFSELMEAVLRKGVPFRFRAGGFSMNPFIRNGDVVTVFPLRGKPPGRGDVIVFFSRENERVTVHRIIGKKENRYSLKGDGLSATDGWIPKERILGIVRTVERGGKKIRLGLGPEKKTIALLSRTSHFFPWVTALGRRSRAGRRRSEE